MSVEYISNMYKGIFALSNDSDYLIKNGLIS